uniref:Uncharacterized protein n=2 Tax=Babesia bovis TaxID=5865 RepID=A7AUQ2_BABBO|eukprot:XP_001610231.1 hypothetical protein [Babesia bovis T2Bo]
MAQRYNVSMLRRVVSQSNYANVSKARLPCSIRRFSFIRNLFDRESDPNPEPLDLKPASVSLYEKESILQTFQTNLDSLLDDDATTINDYVDFITKVKHPPAATPPTLKHHTTARLINLMDALVYLRCMKYVDTYARLLDIVAAELSSRKFDFDSTDNINLIIHCISCIAALRKPSKEIGILSQHINQEFRKHGGQVLKSGMLIELLNAFGHVTHPSMIDFLVHTCTVRLKDILPSDLIHVPTVLMKYKIQNEIVVSAVIQYVVDNCIVLMDKSQLRRFIINVTQMEYLKNSDGMITQRADELLSSSFRKASERYKIDDMLHILGSMPEHNHIPPYSRQSLSNLVNTLMCRVGITSDINETSNALKMMTNGMIITIVECIARLCPYMFDIKQDAVALMDYITSGGKVDNFGPSKLDTLLEMLGIELCHRINIDSEPPVWKHVNTPGGNDRVTVSDISTIVAILNKMAYANETSSLKNVAKELQNILERCLQFAIVDNEDSLFNLVQRIYWNPGLHSNMAKHAFKLVLSLKTSSMTPKLSKITALLVRDIVVAKEISDTQPINIEEVLNHLLEAVNIDNLSDKALRNASEFLSLLYITACTYRTKTGKGLTHGLIPKMQQLLMKLPADNNGILNHRCLQSVLELDSSDPVYQHVSSLVNEWKDSLSDGNKCKLCLHDVLNYVIERYYRISQQETTQDNIHELSTLTKSVVDELGRLELYIENHIPIRDNTMEHNVWESQEGLTALFRPPRENKDIYLPRHDNTLQRYFPVKKQIGIKKVGTPTTMYSIKKMLHRQLMRTTQLELQLAREDKRRSTSHEHIRECVANIYAAINKAFLTVAMYEPIWPDSYLPRTHTERLVKSALKRFNGV